MAIAGGVITAIDSDREEWLSTELASFTGVEVVGVGPKGIAVTLEASTTDDLKKISEKISDLDQVLDFSIGYINWEENWLDSA